MNRNKEKTKRHRARHFRVRKRVSGTPDAPRLAVFRSLKHMYVQLIDDQPETGSRTLASASTNDKELRAKVGYGGNIDAAKAVGAAIAGQAGELGIKKIRFDRGGFKYQGRVKALADAAREAGLEF